MSVTDTQDLNGNGKCIQIFWGPFDGFFKKKHQSYKDGWLDGEVLSEHAQRNTIEAKGWMDGVTLTWLVGWMNN